MGKGVKQGGIFSPKLFNVYVDDLSVQNWWQVSWEITKPFIYTDDVCLVSISSAGMQKLLNICSEYASEHDLLFNNKKTVCMNFKPSKMKMKDPTLYLNKLT